MADSMDKKYSNVPNLRFSKFSENYSSCRFVDALTFLNNNSFSRDEMNFDEGNYKNIHYGDILIKFPTLVDSKSTLIPFVNKNVVVTPKMNLLKDGDIVIADTAEDYTTGKTIELVVGKDKILSGLHTIPCRPKFKFSSGYLGYYLNSSSFRKNLLPLIQGIKVYSVSKYMFNSLYIKYPSLEEQQKVSDLLLKIDHRISTQNKIISDLESLYNGIKEKIIKYTSNQKSITDFLEEVVKKTTIQDEFPVLSSTVKGLFLQTDYFKRNIASENNIGYKIVKKNQIIISPQNLWMGNMTFNDKFENGIVSPSYKVYKIKEGYDANYIVSILTTKKAFYYYSQVSEQGASVVRRNLNIDAFEQLSFPVPSFEKQKEFSRLIRSIRNKLVCENNYLENLILQKKYLLENLFI